jgi:hypothetical protein
MLKYKRVTLVFTFSALWIGNAMATEEPSYKVLVTENSLRFGNMPRC